MRKYHLLTPGPTQVPPQVLEAMARPLIHHRTKEFETILGRVREGLSWLFQVEDDVISLAASGTGGMEAAVANLLSPGGTALAVRGGRFGERWAEICMSFGVRADVFRVEEGRSADPAELEGHLKERDYKALFVQASETSTGAKHDIKAISEMTRNVSPGTLVVVDAITALGVYDVRPEEWGLDAVLTGSQKALMLPPGLAFIWLSERAWAAAEESNNARYYFDLRMERKNQKKFTTAWTPAISLIYGLDVALDMMRAEGLGEIFARHARLAEGVRSAVNALGLELFAKDLLSESVTAVEVPAGIEGAAIPREMAKGHGVTIAGGQGALKGKIFRIGHLGYVDESDMLIAVGALEAVLAVLGYRLKEGAGLLAAKEVFAG